MNMLDSYIDRKTGKARVEYDHPKLEPILAETYGVMVYQEQVQQAAQALAGYSLGQGDILRRAMGKKKPEEMEKQRGTFLAGCAKTSHLAKEQADAIFETLAKFAGYGFNKSHSAAYGIVAFQTAYLKAHYPVEFMSGLISSEMGNMDKLPVFVQEARAMGLEVLPPHVNSGGVRFRPEGNAIRFGLAGIKNVGESAAQEIVAERERGGPYRGLRDFVQRITAQVVNRKTIETLIRCGAFDAPGGAHRARLIGNLEAVMNRAAALHRDRQAGQGNLFASLEAAPGAVSDQDLPEAPAWPENELLAYERELLGIYMSGHPLTQHAAVLKRYSLATVPALAGLEGGSLTRIGGLLSAVDQKLTKKKELMAVAKLEDLEGETEVIVYPDAYRELAPQLVKDTAVLVCGEVRHQEDRHSIVAAEVHPLADAPRLFARKVSLHVPSPVVTDELLRTVRATLLAHPGRVPVVLCMEFPGGEKVFLDTESSCKVNADEGLVTALERLLGEGSVYVAVDPSPCRRERPTRKRWGRGEDEGGPP
jgi:DNA polymerase-3 subunit alpha